MRPARSAPLSALLVVLALARPARAEDAALRIARGETRTGDVVRTGGSVEVDGTLDGTLVLIGGRVSLAGRVTGDVVLFLGGRAEIAPGARIEGSLLSVGGDVVFLRDAAGGATIGGRLLTVGSMEAAILAELRTSPLEGARVSPLLFALRLLLLSVWLLLALALLRLLPRRLLGAASAASGGMALHAALGAGVFVGAVLVSPALLAFLPARLAAGAVLSLVAALLVAKAFGLAALFLALGTRLLRGAPRDSAWNGAPSAVAIGLLTLGAISLLPVAGELIWGAVSLVAIGLALRTAFGSPAPGAAPAPLPVA